MDSYSEKSEKPTSTKLKREKKRGEFAYSPKLASALFLFLIALSIRVSLSWLFPLIQEKFVQFFTLLRSPTPQLSLLIRPIFTTTLLFVFLMTLIAFFSHGLQSGFIFTWHRPKKKSSHLFYHLLFTLITWSLLSLFFYFSLIQKRNIENVQQLLSTLSTLFLKMTTLFLSLSLIDYLFQRHFFYQEMHMTREEVKEEAKEESVKK